MTQEVERWLLTHDGRAHVVELTEAGFQRAITWTVDDEEVASEKTSDDTVTLDGGDHGAVKLKLPTFVGPARRVTWWGGEPGKPALAAATLGIGGLDFDPEPGSKAAEREAWIREHPTQYAVRRTAAAVAGVVVPIVLIWLLGRFALPNIPWPDIPWPKIPWPDWSIPWPTIPWPDWSIPWPEWSLPDWSLPAWLQSLLDLLKYVWPVLLAAALAQREIKRRRDQDARKRAAQLTAADTAQVTEEDSAKRAEAEPQEPDRP
ncbi:hypothetical protein [Nocardioides campestrisoli]|uniref:hypothetical protein n=1 Tax=Nocardioides campestrisoli TaxID=2736757 RepID=UPI00163DB29F|nr:hypothetical protein [Nocardioides campestrisoli]